MKQYIQYRLARQAETVTSTAPATTIIMNTLLKMCVGSFFSVYVVGGEGDRFMLVGVGITAIGVSAVNVKVVSLSAIVVSVSSIDIKVVSVSGNSSYCFNH